MANYATLCLRLVVRIEELILDRKVRQSVATEVVNQTGPKCVTLCLRLVVRIEELTLGRKVRQSVASEAAIQTCP